MPQEMIFVQDVEAAWAQLIKKGKLVSRFTDACGRSIEAGLRFEGESPEYYAKDLSSGVELDVRVEETIYSKFRLQFNPLRAWRPQGRLLNFGRQPDLSADVRDCGFECQNPSPLSLLGREAIFRVSSPNSQFLTFPNATPFELQGHLLWIPCRTVGVLTVIQHAPQVLNEALVEDFLALAKGSRNTAVFFFNSPHAGATVHHLHFQSVAHRDRLALEDAGSTVVGPYTFLQGYPANGLVFSGAEVKAALIWACVEKFQRRGFPYNLIALSDRIFLIPRNVEFELVEEFPMVLASFEFAGKLIMSNRTLYERTRQGAVDLHSVFSKATLNMETMTATLAD